MNDPKFIEYINHFAAFLGDFKPTWQMRKFLRLPHSKIALFCGNQSFKTSGVCYQYVLRVLGQHPVPKKNVVYVECKRRNPDDLSPHGNYWFKDNGVLVRGWERGTFNVFGIPEDGKCPECGEDLVIHQRKSRKIRLCSETLPSDKDSITDDKTQTAETRNTVYPELLKWMPQNLVKRDIRHRSPALIIHDPLKGMELNGTVNRGGDIVFDLMSYGQTVQAGAGVQRMSCYVDEEPSKDFWDEQIPRLLAEDGDLILGLTPAYGLTWTFDSLFEMAQVYYRTDAVIEYLNKTEKDKNYKNIETTDIGSDIAVVQSATDDNPTLSKEVIEAMFADVDDPDVLATRRFGIHKQVTGRIFKAFDYRIHYIDLDNYFPDGVYKSWNHFRMIDYHSHNKWACSWMSISPWDEAFIWREWSPDPEKLITRMICKELSLMSYDYKFRFNIIDPESAKTQTNTGTSTIDDMNGFFHEFKRNSIGTGGYWETWDTKGTRGREVIRTRLLNSVKCGKPFNNEVQEYGKRKYIPTLWISNKCPETAKSLKQWRLEDWGRSAANVNKDRKETPAQKWSHYPTAIEAAFKDLRCKPPAMIKFASRPTPTYFQGATA